MQRAILEETLRLIDARVPFAMATVVKSTGSVPAKSGARMIVRPDGSAMGTVGGAGLERQVTERALECIRAGKGGVYPFILWHRSPGGLDSLCGGAVEVHIEYVKPKPHILICGGGHVGRALAEMSIPLEYFHSVYDVRADFAAAERFPQARGRFSGAAAELPEKIDPAAYSHVVVCGHSYHVDLDLLERILPVFEGWVGVIASKAKRGEMLGRLAERGLARERLERIECPIGLAIGAETPAEIAVSILASIVRRHNLREAEAPAGAGPDAGPDEASLTAEPEPC
jgi:xanthine dehydrogenase accessory factor